MNYSINLDRLINNATVRLPGAIAKTVQDELFFTLDEFFKGSNIWRENVIFTTAPDEASYDLVPSEPGRLHRLIGVWNAHNRPVAATMAVPGTVVLGHTPSSAEELTAQVTFTVTDPTTTDGYPVAPDWIVDRYSAEWLDGVLGRMMSQKSKPYSDKEYSVYHMRRFRDAMARARSEAQRLNTFRTQSWGYPQTFATTRRR